MKLVALTCTLLCLVSTAQAETCQAASTRTQQNVCALEAQVEALQAKINTVINPSPLATAAPAPAPTAAPAAAPTPAPTAAPTPAPTAAPTPAPTAAPAPAPTPAPPKQGTAGTPETVPKSASQSSMYRTAVASLAIDKHTATHWTACTHTMLENNPWWKMNYERPVTVNKVEILNREAKGDRLHDVVVTVDGATCGRFKGPGENKQLVEIPCGKPLVGKELKIQIEGGDSILTLCEVTVS